MRLAALALTAALVLDITKAGHSFPFHGRRPGAAGA